jgi:hypothetical protein
MGEAGQNRRSIDDVGKGVSYLQRKRHISPPAVSSAARAPIVHRSEISEAEIDRTIEDSFPASDPPFWNLGIDRK